MVDIGTVKMVCDKVALVARYCADGDEARAVGGMGDITDALSNVISQLLSMKATNSKFRFDEVGLIGGLQVALSALQTKDLNALASVLSECVRPELEQALSQLEGQAVSDETVTDWVESLELKPNGQVICMFGYGDGACYSELCSRADSSTVFIVYEPETDSVAELKEQLWQHVDFYRLDTLLICAHPGYDKVFATEYVDFIHAINENRESVLVNKNTLGRFKDSASKNVITNLGILKHFNLIGDLEQILGRDVPVIIVSAGPSLDKNIEELKRAKGHALIFAVDTAMKYMMQHDIMPDLGITVEPIKPMANYADDRIFDVPHVFDCESNPEIVSKERGRMFIYNCRDYVKNVLEKAGIEVPQDVASGGSVATAAFAVCYQLQMRTIILIGQDLAYSGTLTHAGGVESAGINGDIGTEMVDGIDGTPVRTRSDWIGYQKWFESAIRTINDQKLDMTVIDATEGGALIHGSKVMTLSDAIDRFCVHGSRSICDYDFNAELAKLEYKADCAKYAEIKKLIADSFRELASVRDNALEAVGICDSLTGNEKLSEGACLNNASEQASIKGAMVQLAKLRHSCESALLFPLINNFAVPDIIDEVNRLRSNTADSLSEIRQQRLAFDAIAKACDYFEPMNPEVN